MILLIALLALICPAKAEWMADGKLFQQEEGLWRLQQQIVLSRDTWTIYSSNRQEAGERALARSAGGLVWQGRRFRLMAGDMQLRDRLGLLGRGSRLSFPSSGQGLIRPGPATASTWQQSERGIFLETGKRRLLTLGIAHTWRDTRADEEGYTLDLVRSPDKSARINAWQDQLALASLRQEGDRWAAELLVALRRSLEPIQREARFGSMRLQRRFGPLLFGSIFHVGEARLTLVDLQLRRSSHSVWRLAVWSTAPDESIWSKPVLSPRSGEALALAWQGRIEGLRIRAELRHEVPVEGPEETNLTWECAAPRLLPGGWEILARSSLQEEGHEEAGRRGRLLRLEKRSRASELRLEYRQSRDGDRALSAFTFQVGGSVKIGVGQVVSRASISISTGGEGGAWVSGSTPGLTGSRYLHAGTQVAVAGFQLRREKSSLALQVGAQELDAWIRLGWSFRK